MMHTLGAAMVMVGMVGLAWRAVARLGEQAELLRSLQGALSYIEEELAFRFTPLPRLLAHLAQSRQGAAGAFFQAVLKELDRGEDVGLRQSWTQAAEQTLPLLKEPERQTLEELGEVLGQYDAQTQAQALHLAGERLAEAYGKAQSDRQRLGKVYLALGLAGGLVTVLVLI